MSAYKKEQTFYADGQHEPIISEALFYEVQDFLNGNKKTYRTKFGSQEIFQLRGFLICPKCNKLLTGSTSKGRNGKYNYYHCSSKCGVRFKSENANELFVRELKKYVPAHKMINIYSQVINSAYLTRSKEHRAGIQSLKLEVDKVNTKLAKSRDLLLTSALDAAEYKEIKSQC